jgi:O-antigen/teichoic acid export membrane protein
VTSEVAELEAGGQAPPEPALLERTPSNRDFAGQPHGEAGGTAGDSAMNRSAARRTRPRANTLAEGVFVVLGMLVIQRTIGFGRGVLFCRWLDPAEFGRWGLTFNFLLLAAPIVVLGLPGSYGRYLEYYRQRGQLALFLRRTSIWTALLAGIAVSGILLTLPTFSELIFGEPDYGALVGLIAFCLAGVILHHFLESLYMALRMNRVVSGMQFCQSVGFAAFGTLLLWFWRMDVVALIVGYCIATFLSAVGGACWLRGILDDQPPTPIALPQRTFWSKLLPFAMWVWMANLLANLFAVVDRYMLVHHAGLPADEAMTQVGYYQSSLIVPLLFISVAELFASILTPHLSHDWERGDQQGVALKLNLALKITAILLLAGSTTVLLIGPLLFDRVLQGKYNGGLDILPLTLVYSSWFGLMMIASNYLWCAERARLCSAALSLGLVSNIGLNWLLLPSLGLEGAVLATTVANALTLGLTVYLSHVIGMRYTAGTLLLLLLPSALAFGAMAGLAAIVAIVLLVARTHWLISAAEKQLLLVTGGQYLQRLKAMFGFDIGPTPQSE